jgi:hypothetical protein
VHYFVVIVVAPHRRQPIVYFLFGRAESRRPDTNLYTSRLTKNVNDNAKLCIFFVVIEPTKPLSRAAFRVYDERKSQGAFLHSSPGKTAS